MNYYVNLLNTVYFMGGKGLIMSGDNKQQRKIITIILSVALALLGIFSFISIQKLQGNARVINYAGVVRGGTQKLVKEELQGSPDDKLMERLDKIIEELLTGEGEHGLIRLNDTKFQELMTQMQESFSVLKEEIGRVRQGADKSRLYSLSQEYFELADQTVSAAETYSEKNARIAERGFMVLAVIFIFVAGFFIWFGSVQNKRQKEIQEAEDENRLKREHLDKMAKELQVPINEISELIYVADVENYDLLFVNEAGKKNFQLDDISGIKCYKALQGQDAPCSFCTNALLKPGENYSWETTNQLTNRHYILKDRLIEWDGKKARLEIAFDMTQMENERQKLKYALDVENMVMECIRVLYQGRDIVKAMNQVLKQLGSFLQAERSYIFSIKDGKMYNEFEWCAQGVEPEIDNLQELPVSLIERWRPAFEKQECVVIENLEEYRESSPKEYETLAAQGISSLVAAPMEKDGVVIGYLGVDNPPGERLLNIGAPLQTLCYFILLTYRRAENEQQLSRLSYHDTLTSFYNRNRFMKDLEALQESKCSVGIIYLDVNGLKEVNDRRGHAEGDRMLVRAADKMKVIFRKEDCYRVGGDEFVIICTDIPKEKFEDKTAELKRIFEDDSRCNAAIGSQWAGEFQNINQIVAKADAMMYEDKKEFYRKSRKGNRYRHHSDEILQLADPRILKQEIDRKRFEVYLQPKISSADRTPVGAEALIRYRSDDGTMVLPGNFLPLLEEARSVSQIDFYVFEFVCSQMEAWAKEGKKASPISVNFSHHSLRQPSFTERLKEICRKYAIPPTLIELEITEKAGDVTDTEMRRLIAGLRSEGFGVTLDDFGTDHADLALLSTAEFDVLKLDRSMVKDIAENSKTQEIVRTIVESCKKTGIKLVAEGIEEEEQLLALGDCGVEYVQGYLFSVPIPIREYENEYL